MEKVDINSPRKWVGRKGLNFRFRLEIWQNLYCDMQDERGVESNGYPMWEFWADEPCDAIFRTRKKLKQHKEEHLQFRLKGFKNANV
jgi:hypothetical protein